jgi:GNAT superfamily N-acetyltransferase
MAGEDKPAIMAILQDTPEFKPEEVTVAEEVIDSYLGDPAASGYRILVAVSSSKVVGYICYGPTPLTAGTWDLYWAAVARQWRGKGVGKALWESAECQIRQSRGRLAVIETSSKPEYEATRHFHSSRGYQPVCRVADFYAPGDDKMIFVKSLQKPVSV